MYQSLLQNVILPKAGQTQSPIQSPVPLSSTSATSSLSLPNYPTVSQQPFTWGNLTSPEFTKLLDTVCEEVLHWRCNCYPVPNGKVEEVLSLNSQGSTWLMLQHLHWNQSLWKLLLCSHPATQKPSKQSKSKEHTICLERRLKSWFSGDLEELLKEGRALQQLLPKYQSAKANSTLAWSFANLMFIGKCKAAIDQLSNSQKGELLHLDDHSDPASRMSPKVWEVLISKHPSAQPAHQNCILQEEPNTPHSITYEWLDATMIWSAAL